MYILVCLPQLQVVLQMSHVSPVAAVQDILELQDQDAVYALLQSLFRSKTTLKVCLAVSACDLHHLACSASSEAVTTTAFAAVAATRSPTQLCALQVGFGLKGDLWAVAQSLPDGNNCIAVVSPALELRVLHAHLQRKGLAAQVQLVCC